MNPPCLDLLFTIATYATTIPAYKSLVRRNKTRKKNSKREREKLDERRQFSRLRETKRDERREFRWYH